MNTYNLLHMQVFLNGLYVFHPAFYMILYEHYLLCHALRRDTVLGAALSEAAITARLPLFALICPTSPHRRLPSWFHPGRFLTTVYFCTHQSIHYICPKCLQRLWNYCVFDLTSALADMIDVFLFVGDLSHTPCNLLVRSLLTYFTNILCWRFIYIQAAISRTRPLWCKHGQLSNWDRWLDKMHFIVLVRTKEGMCLLLNRYAHNEWTTNRMYCAVLTL